MVKPGGESNHHRHLRALVQKSDAGPCAADRAETARDDDWLELIDLDNARAPTIVESIAQSVSKTSRVVIAHEETMLSFGFGAEIAARLWRASCLHRWMRPSAAWRRWWIRG